MIRGILSTVRYESLVPGAFYLQQLYGSGPTLMQVATFHQDNEADRHFGLHFEPGAAQELMISELDQHGYFALMPDVSVRVDPPSITGTPATHNLRAGNFFVSGEVPYVVAYSGRIGHQIVNLATGVMEQRHFAREAWIAFSRWQLVVDENGEEVPIASFGDAPASI